MTARERWVFLGDSVTDSGRTTGGPPTGDGYVSRIAHAVTERGLDVEVLNRGVNGDQAADVLRRVESDCIELAPDLVSIMVGVNDTWRRYDSDAPVPLEAFTAAFDALVDRLRSVARVVVMTPFLLPVAPGQGEWLIDDLGPKIEVERASARRVGAAIVDAQSAMEMSACAPMDLAFDGVHPTAAGFDTLAAAWIAEVLPAGTAR
ncbi:MULTISPECIES: SGNH/GDSL hydrolase family protein [unclassified Microbacterium]|uniref:SGNH/GDSL hydrolase family protein n=1 Tax=unclassified Microbacterium TaxID=2609290 RepID=UPI001604E15A|nr:MULTISPECIES: SGNH/GDSL hydrolase family protein [unclassified Microbacterium]QNA93528.1 SGNH/GDSL hydrolase family protein [Microbacterium sp. Se63.02b]QYM63777.1 SGNH/GDSL hydrolase family protein [Microbacterium sp. Se5.02b]